MDKEQTSDEIILTPEHRKRIIDSLQPGQPAIETLLKAQVIKMLQAGYRHIPDLEEVEEARKAGMKEVVDWMDQFKVERLNTGKIRFVLSMDLWQAFLKSKSIEEEHEQDRN